MDLLFSVLVLVPLATLAAMSLANLAYKNIENQLFPRYPQCDIDPRCHPAYVADQSGQGWVGNVKVKEWPRMKTMNRQPF